MLARELLAKVRKIEIKTRRLVDEITGGAYHSVFKGRGIEFSEVREYTPEDDVRDIDWNVTARMGSPFIKKYAEERELTVILAVDVSASGLFGSSGRNKREQMIEAAALLAFSAIRNNDKVGLLLFSDRTELYLPPRSGRTHVLRVIRELVAADASGRGTDIGAALESLSRSQKKKAVVFLISDFIDGKDYERSMKLLSLRHDLVAIRVLDEREIALPSLAEMSLEDSENGGTLSFNASSGKRLRAYETAQQLLHKNTGDICRRSKVDMIDIRCGEDLLNPLMTFFQNRKLKHS